MGAKSKTLKKAEKSIQSGVETAKDWVAPKVESALAWAEESLKDGADKAAPLVHDGLEAITHALHTARQKVEEEYAPAAAEQLADMAGKSADALHKVKISDGVNTAVTKVTGDKRAARKLKKAAENYAKSAEKRLKKQAKKQRRSSAKGWVIAGIVVAAGGAAYAVWQLTKPVEDPWKNPTPQPLSNQAAQQPAGGNAVVDSAVQETPAS